MNPLGELAWWREGIIAVLLLAVAVQEARVRSVKVKVAELAGQVAVYKQLEDEARRAAAVRALHNLKNKERTDEEYRAARARAGAVVVRVDPSPGVVKPGADPAADGGDDIAGCFDGRGLAEALAGLFQRHADRLNQLAAGLAERDGARRSGDARAGEEVAAAYRAARDFLLSLDGADRTPKPGQ